MVLYNSYHIIIMIMKYPSYFFGFQIQTEKCIFIIQNNEMNQTIMNFFSIIFSHLLNFHKCNYFTVDKWSSFCLLIFTDFTIDTYRLFVKTYGRMILRIFCSLNTNFLWELYFQYDSTTMNDFSSTLSIKITLNAQGNVSILYLFVSL